MIATRTAPRFGSSGGLKGTCIVGPHLVDEARSQTNGSGVVAVRARLDSGAEVDVPVLNGRFSFTTSMKLDGTADGAHVVGLSAVDAAGQSTSLKSSVFTLDTRPPALPGNQPQGIAAELSENGVLNIKGTAGNDQILISGVMQKVDGTDLLIVDPADRGCSPAALRTCPDQGLVHSR